MSKAAASPIKISGTRASGRDCLIHQESADEFLMGLARHEITAREEVAELIESSREALAIAYGYEDDEDHEIRKPFVYKDGVAVIPVHGTLINRFGDCWGFVTGYNYIRRQINLALYDDDVELIVLDIDSPGGEAAGNFELAREIMQARDDKPFLAVVDSRCMSGGYSIAASCNRIAAIPSAAIGSIGVYRMHMDISKMLDQQGVKVTFAKAGEHKTDGNPFEPLSPEVLRDWEESAGKTWDDFIAVVAEGRDLTPEQVRDTQARVYRSDEALALGLIDAVKTPSEAVASFVAELAEDEPFNKEDEMAGTPKTQPEATSGQPQNQQPQVSADAIAAAIAAHETAKRERRVAIRALPEAEGRDKLVQSLIEDTDLSPEQCKVVLASAAKETPQGKAKVQSNDEDEDEDEDDDADADEGEDDDGESASASGDKKKKGKKPGQKMQDDGQNHFLTAMNNSQHPGVKAGREKAPRQSEERSNAELAQDILGAQAKASGRKIEAKAA